MRIPAILLLVSGLSLQAQALYQSRPTSDAACPRIEGHEDAMFRKGGQRNTTGGIAGAVGDQVMAGVHAPHSSDEISSLVDTPRFKMCAVDQMQ